jgi:hypothetical protein
VKAVLESLPQGEITMRILAKVSARLIAAAFAAVTLVPLAQAQHLSFSATVDVPFAFETASGKHFAPGVYEMRLTGQSILEIRSKSASGMVMVSAGDEGKMITHGTAIFAHYGDKYYLRSVAVADTSTRLTSGRSKSEKRSEMAAVQPAPMVELAVLSEKH